MNNDLLIKIAEGIIFTSQEPIKVKDLSNRLPECKDIDSIIDFLVNKYKQGGFVLEKGHKNIPGRPSTWRTTKDFLDHFGLASLKELPGISELKSAGLLARNIGPSVLNRDNISEL